METNASASVRFCDSDFLIAPPAHLHVLVEKEERRKDERKRKEERRGERREAEACYDWATHADGWCLGVRFLDVALVCDCMSDGVGGFPMRFHGLMGFDDWVVHVAGWWCLGV